MVAEMRAAVLSGADTPAVLDAPARGLLREVRRELRRLGVTDAWREPISQMTASTKASYITVNAQALVRRLRDAQRR